MSRMGCFLALVAAIVTAAVGVAVSKHRPQPAAAEPVPERRTIQTTYAPALEKPNIRQLKAGYHNLPHAGVPSALPAWGPDGQGANIEWSQPASEGQASGT